MNKRQLAERHRVTGGKGFRLKDVDPPDTAGLDVEKDEAKELLPRVSRTSASCRRGSTPKASGQC
jgi:hypothetical protein